MTASDRLRRSLDRRLSSRRDSKVHRSLRCAVSLFLLLLATAASAADSANEVEAADRAFFETITTRPRSLEHLLAENFVYRTSEGTTIGKAALIQRLESGATRVRAPRIRHTQHASQSSTAVSRGIIELEFETPAGWQRVRSSFTHVWIHETAHWQLLYRESTVLADDADQGR